MFSLHLGMKVCLTESICKEKGLVKDAEGVVVHITVHPDDEDMVRRGIKDAEEGREVQLYLSQVPFGIWLQMDKYDETPAAEQLAQNIWVSSKGSNVHGYGSIPASASFEKM